MKKHKIQEGALLKRPQQVQHSLLLGAYSHSLAQRVMEIF